MKQILLIELLLLNPCLANGLKHQIWVTSVVSDEDVEKALVLCYSLRRTFTRRKIAVIASTKISMKLKKALTHGFDLVFNLDEDYYNSTKLSVRDFAKLYCFLALRSFDNCAYVSASMLAVKNCDDIFSKETDGIQLGENDTDASLFVFKPSYDTFKSLVTGLENFNFNGMGFGIYLKNWIQQQCMDDASPPLDKKFNVSMTPGKHVLGYEEEISMVNLVRFSDVSGIEDMMNTGILGKLVGLHWQKSREGDVLPIIQDSVGSLPFLAVDDIQQLPTYHKEPIAIVGMSCRFPGSNNLEEFWNLLFHGQDATTNPPPFRWMREQCSKHVADARNTNAGFLKDPVDEFDAKFFGISPKEAVFMDPQHRILYEVVWEGLEDACIDPHSLRGTPGSAFLGTWTNDYKDIVKYNGSAEYSRTYMGNSIGAASGRVSSILGMTGPSIATESGCSSSIVAVHLACRSLQLGETNLALAGGVNLLLDPFDHQIFPIAISPDGHCKTFSDDANGFARAEGCGVLVLKRLSDALKNGDKIWALVGGSAIGQEGLSKSMGTPTVRCESVVMKDALRDAGVRPEEVSYVETHGTGTVVGDPVEVAAIAKAYGSLLRQEPLIIGSVKTNVGHTESCSGITGIIKVVLAMKYETIPAHINFTTLNPNINLDSVPAVIPMERMEWIKCTGKPRIAGVSSFGITGTDAHVIIQEPADEHTIPHALALGTKFQRPLHILTISAKTEQALDILISKYKNYLETSNDAFPDLAYSANVGRAHFHHRVAIIGKTKEDMISSIQQQKYLKGECDTYNSDKICFLFTGQSSEYPGMAKNMHRSSPVFQMHFDYCESIVKTYFPGMDLKNVLWSEHGQLSQKYSKDICIQTSTFCVQYALLKLWESWGVKPDFALGHSMGEFAAAVCAGIMSMEDVVKLTATRSMLINELEQGKMLVLQTDSVSVEREMKLFAGNDTTKLLDIAAMNSSLQTVVAGDSDVVIDFSKYCTKIGIKNVILPSTHAFHSKHLDPIQERYRDIAKTTTRLDQQKCVYISGMTGDIVDAKEIDADYWAKHVRQTVNFLSASKKATELGCRIFIEVGPQPVLTSLTMMNNEDVNLLCLPSLKRKEHEWETMLTSLGKLYLKGVAINWEGFDQFYNREKVRLPHYPFIRKKFWPEMNKGEWQMSGNMIHPLVGSVIPNASCAKIFQSGINCQTHEYLKDHAIRDTVLFPAAGYLEMSLAAGLATLQECFVDSLGKPSTPINIQNLVVTAPLALEDSKACPLQTVSQLKKTDDRNEVRIEIYRRIETDSAPKWLLHATATYSPIFNANEQAVAFDKEEFVHTLSMSPETKVISDAYEKLASVGLNFGAKFRSLEQVWRNKEKNTLLAKLKLPNEESGQYILHPVVLDAMIQTIMMLKLSNGSKAKLHVPIKIGKFLWLSNGDKESNGRYVHVFERLKSNSERENKAPLSANNFIAYLLDSKGNVLAVMSEVELIETTVKAVEAILEQQTSAMPDLWQETWRPKLGPSQHRHDLSLCMNDRFYDEEFKNDMDQKYNVLSPKMEEILKKVEGLVYYNFLRCLYQCGWKPTLNAIVVEEELREHLQIKSGFSKMLRYMLRVLEEEGILKNKEPFRWEIVAMPPTMDLIEDQLASSKFTSELVMHFGPTLLLRKLGENYSEIMKGNQSALSILFPQDGPKTMWPSVAQFYGDYAKLIGMEDMCSAILLKHAKHCKKHYNGERNVCRILEIGAGTGSTTKHLLETMKTIGFEFEYTFTDVLPAFFSDAEKLLEPYSKHVTFKKLNIEEDPISQGFIPNYYDWIIAGDVIHATRNLGENLENVRMLLKPCGTFDLIEQTKVSRLMAYLFGLLEGYWRFEDLDLIHPHGTLSNGRWFKTLSQAGFDVVGDFPCFTNCHSYISTRKLELENLNFKTSQNPRLCWVVFHQDDIPTSKYLLEQISSIRNRKVIIVRRDEKFVKTLSNQDWRFDVNPKSEKDFNQLIKCIESCEDTIVEGILYCWSLDKTCTTQDDILQPYFYAIKAVLGMKQPHIPKIVTLVKGVVDSVEGSDLSHYPTSTIWGFTKALVNEHIEVNCRCVDIGDKEEATDLEQVFYELWNTDRQAQVAYNDSTRYVCKIRPLKPSMSDLKLPKGSDRFQLLLPHTKSIYDLEFDHLDTFSLEDGEIEIQVRASALNFRDVFSVLKPTDQFKNINAVGFDFAGIVKQVGPQVTKWSVGSQVFGVNANGAALPSHIKLNENDVLPVPETMTLCEASTLPAVVTTSYHCLIDVAKITSADTVLIHTASGGVGLSSIEICKSVGASIIATAGSKRKQNYLRSLGIEHVFHSRNTNYGDDILRVTNGRGVDVVLNSLTSEGFKEATLKACANGARFVEMSKLNIWKPEQVKKLRPDVSYNIVDVSSMDKSDWRRLMDVLNQLVDRKVINPLPYVRFDGVHIREALQMLQDAAHIGKVVCMMPEVRQRHGNLEVYTPLFSENATYLITGGLGGIGFVVCKWMVEKGAKHVLLAGRNSPTNSMQRSIDSLNLEHFSNVQAVQLDVGDYAKCRELLNIKVPEMGLPQIRGIMHAAGTLCDGLIENQTWKTLSSTFNTKVDGTLNLHELTKNLSLEHFVLFSSMASLFGSPGQSNHSAGNYFEDIFAHYRHSIGLPATSMNWGPWGEVGVATEVDLPGVKTLSNLQCLTALEFALKSHRVQTGAINISSPSLLCKCFPQISQLLDERVWKSSEIVQGNQLSMKPDEFWERYDNLEDIQAKIALFKEKLQLILRNILKLEQADTIEENANFQEMGVDSLMFVEIRNALQALMGNRITVNASALRDCNTVGHLASTLVNVIEGNELEIEKVPTLDQVADLMIEDCRLPESIMSRPSQERVTLDEIHTVLLTGCSGTLGPYILMELMKVPQVTQVVCLMRPNRNVSEEERLRNILEERGLLSEVNMGKVRCVSGNVALPNLGMESIVWNELCDSLDAVFHCAANVLHMEHYTKRKSDRDSRAVNIGGVKNILELASTGNKLKHVYCASSLVAVSSLDGDGNFSESWPEPTDYNGVTTRAYPITKFVGDVLMKQAILERDIPGKVFRFPLIVGDSKIGGFVDEQNHFMLRYLFILKNRMMPNSHYFPLTMLPVDVCAWASVKIFFNPNASNDIYNVCNAAPFVDQEFVVVAKRLGFDINLVEYSEFCKTVMESTAEDSPFVLFKDFYGGDGDFTSLFNTAPILRNWVQKDGSDKSFMVSRKIGNLLPEFFSDPSTSADHLYRDLLFAKNQGWFEKYHIL